MAARNRSTISTTEWVHGSGRQELKAGLSADVRAARAGDSVIVCDHETPIARLVPYAPEAEPLAVRRAIRTLHARRRW